MGKLSDMKVKNAKPGTHGDGAGLYLRVKPTGAKSWVLRVQFNGRRSDIGLGGYPADLSLGEARDKAAHLRKLARQGKNAHAERDREKVTIPTFAEAVAEAHKELKKGWSEKNAASFKASLEQHIVPRIGNRLVSEIGSSDVIAALAPIWTDKPEVARKARSRMLQVLSFAKARGWRTMPLPDQRELRDGLAKQPRRSNFEAMPYADVPAFVAKQLTKEEAPGRLALLFTIFTAARSGEVRAATWDQIDFEACTWTRSAEVMKMRTKHVVTLNDAAIAILRRAEALFGDKGVIFPGMRSGSSLSDMSLSKLMRSAGEKATVHGFRSSFRDWAAEKMPTIPAMVAEMALAHKVGTATEQAYLRSDLREMRRALMGAWGAFVAPSLSGQGQ
jgi:integrase